jgi:Fur family peroxide stress response transcriptional regulator
MRTNIYKDQIVKLLKKKHLLTIAQIHKAIPNVDYSTVFRNVEQLLKGGAIKQVLVDSKSVAYESSSESHDHFICNDCGKVESIHIPHNSIEGRKIDDITVRGSCTDCIE